MRTPLTRSWRYDALVAEYHKSMGRIAAYKAEYRQLANEHTALIEKLHAWKKEKEKTGRITSERLVPTVADEAGPYTPVPQETHDHLMARMVQRKNGRVFTLLCPAHGERK